MSSLPALVELEGRIIRLYRLIELESTSPVRRAYLQTQLENLAAQPELFQYLLNDPIKVNEEQWRPLSPTVSAVTTCFLAMNAITTTTATTVSITFEIIQTCECACVFLPRAFKWIPFLHPAYGTLPYHPVHNRTLVNALQAMYRYGRGIPSFRDQSATLCGYIASLWAFHIIHPECDTPSGAACRPSEGLAICVLDMLRPKGAESSAYPDMARLTSAVRTELLRAMQRSPRRIFVQLLLFAFTLLERGRAALDSGFAILNLHVRTIELLVRQVFPSMRHSPNIVRLVVGIVRLAPCPRVAEAGCDLLIAICEMASGYYPLRWALRFDIVDAVRCNSHVTPTNLFGYIAVRTTSRSVMEVLSHQDESSVLIGKDLTDDVSLAMEFDSIIRDRLKVYRMAGNKARCAMSPKAHWPNHKLYCLWRMDSHPDYDESPADSGYVLLHIIHYVLSDRGRSLLQALRRAEAEDRLNRGTRELSVEISLDQFPPAHTIVIKKRDGCLQEESVLKLQMKVYLRQYTTATMQPRSLRTFMATVQAVSDTLEVADAN
ncbi:hypothetical protein FB107DRAFT_225390 [Schizophyllum commune]